MPALLDLPPEIRNRIYFFVESLVPTLFLETEPRVRTVDGGNDVGGHVIHTSYNATIYYLCDEAGPFMTPVQPNITMTCHQICDETLPIFYGVNAFCVVDNYWPGKDGTGLWDPFPQKLTKWFNRIKQHLPLVKAIELYGREGKKEGCAQLSHELVSAFTDAFDFRAGALFARPGTND